MSQGTSKPRPASCMRCRIVLSTRLAHMVNTRSPSALPANVPVLVSATCLTPSMVNHVLR
eukprot:5198383-Karenia_brevis.AAC.1